MLYFDKKIFTMFFLFSFLLLSNVIYTANIMKIEESRDVSNVIKENDQCRVYKEELERIFKELRILEKEGKDIEQIRALKEKYAELSKKLEYCQKVEEKPMPQPPLIVSGKEIKQIEPVIIKDKIGCKTILDNIEKNTKVLAELREKIKALLENVEKKKEGREESELGSEEIKRLNNEVNKIESENVDLKAKYQVCLQELIAQPVLPIAGEKPEEGSKQPIAVKPPITIQPIEVSPCEEVKRLEVEIREGEEKLRKVKEDFEKAEKEKVYSEEDKKLTLDAIKNHEKEIEMKKERMEKMKEKCEKGEEKVKEHPCIALSRIDENIEKMKTRLLATEKEEDIIAISKELNGLLIARENVYEQCVRRNLEVKDISSVSEIEKVVEVKKENVLAEKIATGDDKKLEEELNKIEEEKARLVKEFAEKMKVLELRKQEIIKAIEIGKEIKAKIGEKKEMEVLPAEKLKVEVNGKIVEVLPGEEVKIKDENIEAKTKD